MIKHILDAFRDVILSIVVVVLCLLAFAFYLLPFIIGIYIGINVNLYLGMFTGFSLVILKHVGINYIWPD